MNEQRIDLTDPRWGNYVPWFLRNKEINILGDFTLFFDRVSQRLERFFLYESGLANLMHYGDMLETKSFQRFRHERKLGLALQLKIYFAKNAIINECSTQLQSDKAIKDAQTKFNQLISSQKMLKFNIARTAKNKDDELNELDQNVRDAETELKDVTQKRAHLYYSEIYRDRLTVLESILISLNHSEWVADLISDIRRFFAEASLLLDIQGMPPEIIPMEEPLLRDAVINNLLPRLYKLYPERATELVDSYHRTLTGDSLDSVFISAFKSLEEIARALTGDSNFKFDRTFLKKYYSLLHPTIHDTMIKLSAHRGDEAGHGKSSPDVHEIRYLLFSICNIALLLLDYPEGVPKK